MIPQTVVWSGVGLIPGSIVGSIAVDRFVTYEVLPDNSVLFHLWRTGKPPVLLDTVEGAVASEWGTFVFTAENDSGTIGAIVNRDTDALVTFSGVNSLAITSSTIGTLSGIITRFFVSQDGAEYVVGTLDGSVYGLSPSATTLWSYAFDMDRLPVAVIRSGRVLHYSEYEEGGPRLRVLDQSGTVLQTQIVADRLVFIGATRYGDSSCVASFRMENLEGILWIAWSGWRLGDDLLQEGSGSFATDWASWRVQWFSLGCWQGQVAVTPLPFSI